ncbi:YhgE/Pip family protein [Staphylococcus hyicus]|uniref:YhgE/Pip domain-containing protein n=1 Tax=Staphylococcus hyicus TaxID=1284 RepID=A0A418JIN2_STAHY|nr:YhgE/Pip family protein [Staphylococcus hyicus]MCE5155033.1 YhgE/Pip family protein [Staphylococcus hyicus]RIO45620.1 YhgE/Pip domain-containing protein [Staphylococcus hyicus]
MNERVRKNNKFNFKFVSEETALENLKGGESIGTIIIPKNTSKKASEILGGNPKRIEIITQTNPASSYSVSQMAESANNLIVNSVENNLRSKYLEQIFKSINDSHKGYENISSSLGNLSSFQNQIIAANDNLSASISHNITFPDTGQLLTYNNKITENMILENGKINELKNEIDSNVNKSKAFNFKNINEEVLNNPVKVSKNNLTKIDSYGETLIPYMGCASLFIGAIAFSASYPLRAQILKDNSALRQTIGKLLLYILQGSVSSVILSCLIMFIFKMPIDNIPRFIFISILWSIVAISITSFLALLLDKAGVFLSMILLIFQLSSSEGMFPIALSGKFFQVLNPILPMTYAIDGFRQAIYTNVTIYHFYYIVALLLVCIFVLMILQFLVIKWFKNMKKLPFHI